MIIRITAATPELFKKFGWIPAELLLILNLGEPDIVIEVEKVFDEFILPYGPNDTDNCLRLLYVFASMENKDFVFLKSLAFQTTYANSVKTYVGFIADLKVFYL